MGDFEDIKAHIRDINLDIIMDKNNDVDIDISRRYHNRFRLFYPSQKLIDCTFKNGGVLTGSRALRCYTISGKPILERRGVDWDFVVTLDQAFKICDEMDINQIPSIGSTISIANQRSWRHPSYSDSYRVGPVDVQLIVKDELPDFKQIKSFRIADFGYTISNKINILNDLKQKMQVESILREEYNKHIEDLKQIIIKFNSIGSRIRN
jgi:hypothetical protein